MKGIVLAGGTGSRLWPITISTSKQLVPVYDKPMIYYPISTLLLAGVRDILIITTPSDQASFQKLLGDGAKFGIRLTYAAQSVPEGIAQALIIAKEFLRDDSFLLILGDNIFHGAGLGNNLRTEIPKSGAHIFTYIVDHPSEYGVLEVDDKGNPISIEEKPANPKSSLAVTGLYFFDNRAIGVAEKIEPSARGELEITSVIEYYLKSKELTYTNLSRGTVWLDTGNPKSLHDASSYIRVIEERTGLKIGCIEEISFQNGWLTKEKLQEQILLMKNAEYNKYLAKIIEYPIKSLRNKS